MKPIVLVFVLLHISLQKLNDANKIIKEMILTLNFTFKLSQPLNKSTLEYKEHFQKDCLFLVLSVPNVCELRLQIHLLQCSTRAVTSTSLIDVLRHSLQV